MTTVGRKGMDFSRKRPGNGVRKLWCEIGRISDGGCLMGQHDHLAEGACPFHIETFVTFSLPGFSP